MLWVRDAKCVSGIMESILDPCHCCCTKATLTCLIQGGSAASTGTLWLHSGNFDHNYSTGLVVIILSESAHSSVGDRDIAFVEVTLR